MPPGVAAKIAPIEKGKPDATIELTGPAGLAEGDYPFRVTGAATFQNQPKRVTLDNLVLRVVKPILVSVVPAGPLAAGYKQSVSIKLTRFGDVNGPVTFRCRPLPAGITMPPEVTVPEGQSEATLELSASPDAAAGKAALDPDRVGQDSRPHDQFGERTCESGNHATVANEPCGFPQEITSRRKQLIARKKQCAVLHTCRITGGARTLDCCAARP